MRNERTFEKTCIVCGKSFKGHHKATVCSPECRNKRDREISKAKRIRNRKHIKCLSCGSDFEVAGGRFRYCPLCRYRHNNGEPILTLREKLDVIRAQDSGDREILWNASQSWTPKQHKFAKSRWEEIHPSHSVFTWGKY